ncbi:MAG: hypothetical protein UR94_C0015G0011 [Parcubacteria group bacterium GW2011_GWA2_36_10]|nr:MAG: hypothetical protein UR94_C0015G0011 [Parcubacteria group bacterium GW2011_GWA2_36_10]
MKKLLAILLLLPNITLAQSNIMQNLDAATTAYKQDVPLMQVIGSIIKIFLMLLGTIFVILLLFGGFKWMTAQGDPKKVDEARDLIKNSVVGVVIILAAYAIASFVLREVYTATTVNITN